MSEKQTVGEIAMQAMDHAAELDGEIEEALLLVEVKLPDGTFEETWFATTSRDVVLLGLVAAASEAMSQTEQEDA